MGCKPVPEVRLVGWDNFSVRLTVDGVEYRYETSYYIVQKVRTMILKSPIRALNFVKRSNYRWEKTGRIIDWGKEAP